MSNVQVQLRRGTTAQHAVYTGPQGEVTVDTDKNALVLHDGATAGGKVMPTGDVVATGSTASRTLADRFSDVINVKNFGAIGDGVTDDTNAITAAADTMTSGSTLYFPQGTYLVSYQGTAYSSVSGNVIVDLNGLTDIALIGAGAVIKVSNHDISTYGGLRFVNLLSCKRVLIEGFYFDLSYTGFNNSSSHYPFVGAITAFDSAPTAGQDFSTLNSDLIITNCSFKLYHPDGAFRSTSNPYSGDANNGFKNFAIYCNGPYQDTPYDSQCRNLLIEDCTFEKGGNSYIVYVQAWNNVQIKNNTVDGHISNYTDASGDMQKGAIPAFRFQHYHTEGLLVHGNYYKVLPQADRTGAYNGNGYFMVSGTSASTATEGSTIVSNNTIILGGNDSTRPDIGVSVSGTGNYVIQSNIFKVLDFATDQNIFKYPIYHGDNSNTKYSTLSVINNTFGPNIGGAGIRFLNGTSWGSRPCRQLIVQGNNYKGGYALLHMFAGVQSAIISGNTVDGDGYTEANNYTFTFQSRSIILAGMLSTPDFDSIECHGNVIANTTYGIESPLKYPSFNSNLGTEDTLKIYNNRYTNVTYPTRYNVAITNATNASPIVITSAANRLDTGDVVKIVGVGGNTAANGSFTITRIDGDNFSLDGTTGNGAYTSGGTWEINRSRFQSIAFRTNNSTLTNNILIGTDKGNPGYSNVDGISLNTSNIGGAISASSNGYQSLELNRSGTGGTEDGNVALIRRNGVAVGSISVSAGATAYNTSSDYRLKENVKELSNALERLKQLSVKRFNFKGSNKEVDGFIAHEVSEVVPEAVNGDKDGVDAEGEPVYQGIDQSKLVPLLTSALIELTKKVEALENQ